MINSCCLLQEVLQTITEKKCLIIPLRSTWEDYEKEKQAVLDMHLAPEDYQNSIRKMATELGL